MISCMFVQNFWSDAEVRGEKLNSIISRFKEAGYKIQYEPSSDDGPGEVRAVTFEDIVIEANYGY